MKIIHIFVLVLLLSVVSVQALLENGDSCTLNSQCASNVCNLDICIPQYPADWATLHGPDENSFAADFWSNAYFNLTGGTIQGMSSSTLNYGGSTIPPKVYDMGGNVSGTMPNTYTNTVVVARTTELFIYGMSGPNFAYKDSLDLNITIADFAIVKKQTRPQILVIGTDGTGRTVGYSLFVNNQTKLEMMPFYASPWNLTGGATANFKYYSVSCAAETNPPYDGYCAAVAGNWSSNTAVVSFINPKVIGADFQPLRTNVPIGVYPLRNTIADSTANNPRAGIVYNTADQFSFYATSDDLGKIVRLDLNITDQDTTGLTTKVVYYNVSGWSGTGGATYGAPYDLIAQWPNTMLVFIDFKNSGRLFPCTLSVSAVAGAYTTFLGCMQDDTGTYSTTWGSTGINYGSNEYVFGLTAFRNNIGDIPIICQFTYVAGYSGPNYHELGCTKWNGAGFTTGGLYIFNPYFAGTAGPNFYLVGLDRTPGLISFKPTQYANNHLLVANTLYSVNPSTLAVAIAYENFTSPDKINKSMVIAANVGYGLNLELIAATDSQINLISAGYGSITTPGDEYITPTINQSLYLNGGFYGYYNVSCAGSTATFKARECTIGVPLNQCNYVTVPSTNERLAADCPTESNLTYGLYNSTTPQVSCVLPNSTGPISIRVYIQSELDPYYFGTNALVNFTMDTVNCDLPGQLIPDPIYIGPPITNQTNQTPGGGGPGPVVLPGDLIDSLLGSTPSAWKLFIGIVLVIGAMWAAATVIGGAPHSNIIIGAVGVLMFFFASIIGLIPAYVLVVVGAFVTIAVIAWRAFFPNAGG